MKSQQELKKIVTISGFAVHQRALVFIENLFKTLPEAQRTQKLTPRLELDLATTWRHLH